MSKELKILVVEDVPTDVELIERELGKEQMVFITKRVETREGFVRELKDFSPDIILSDYNLPSFDGMSALEIAKENYPDVPFIFVTGSIGEEGAIETLKSGATDYVLKERISRLVLSVRRALREAEEIREHKRALEALQESEERYRTLVEHTYDLISEVNYDGRLLYVSPRHKDVLGYDSLELTGKNIFQYAHQHDRLFVMSEFQRAMSEFVSGHVIFRFKHKNGSWSWLESTGKPFRSANGEIRGVIASRDITERKQSEEKIREQAELLDKAQDAISVQDLENRIVYWNKSAENLYGWNSEEVTGKNVADILYPGNNPQLIEAQKAVSRKGEWAGELSQVTKEGEEIKVGSRWNLVRDHEGKPKSILVVNTDITDKKKLEAQFLRSQRMESIGTLAGGIAHDLNNVLQPIMMALQLLRKTYKDEQSQSWIDTLESSAERGANLVKQVLSFAKGMEGERTVIQIRYVIAEIEKIVKETFPKYIEIKTDLAKDLWTVHGDVTQLYQVLMNICVNARDAMPNGGVLSIYAENLFVDDNYAQMHIDAKVGPYAVITVSDTGTGIAPELKDRIFEPFFTTKEPEKGTGLGLSTAYGIVKGHGGFINVYSEVGKGTRFKVYLPAIETHETQKIGEKQIDDLLLGHGQLILMVDDEVSVREIARVTLENYGYKVIIANDGAEAVALYAQNIPDIKAVILDMMMPIMDGPASIRALRKVDPDVKIVAVSGLKEYSRLGEVASTSVNAFLSKPFTAEALLRTLHKVLTLKQV